MSKTDIRLAGPFIGLTGDRHIVWRGIRYARATRFGFPTQEPLPEREVSCDTTGPSFAQDAGMGAQASDCDDAYFLNIYSPAADGIRRPVMVWIHGGAFLSGSGSLYDAGSFASDGDMVVVTINYQVSIIELFCPLSNYYGGYFSDLLATWHIFIRINLNQIF